MNFSGDFGNESLIWYPASGLLDDSNGSLSIVGSVGFYWSCSPCPSSDAYHLYFSNGGNVGLDYSQYRAYGTAVRCLKEQ